MHWERQGASYSYQSVGRYMCIISAHLLTVRRVLRTGGSAAGYAMAVEREGATITSLANVEVGMWVEAQDRFGKW